MTAALRSAIHRNYSGSFRSFDDCSLSRDMSKYLLVSKRLTEGSDAAPRTFCEKPSFDNMKLEEFAASYARTFFGMPLHSMTQGNRRFQFEKFQKTHFSDDLDLDNASLVDSLSLSIWAALMDYYGDDPNFKRKFLSELGLTGNSLLSILETVVRLPACLIVGNKISHYIAQGINFFANRKRNDDQILINYLELRKKLNRSLGRNVESVAQNCTSLVTNLMRRGYQERTAQKINDHVVDGSEKVLSLFEHVLSPFFILKLALGKLPTGTDMVTFYSDMKKYDPKYYSRERSNSL
ncbi:MAG: hypothetical protein KR126chlam4_00175 [Candidatus Anoxychlamydiales bacterium]|uniref:Uncharacterized protein n=1 Tax=marine sediment metagenome TaxID=412755 RepID=A0A0F9N1S2_9ZZZZ|nr:hypothetical protein [Candidatus Anoxychlamydiales bacterium]NGX40356.1 hypothetical protein [Candidatus Anoxychlamydiales bacterium]HEU64475.1 hypothetical protein [Chlamydiota bacterium]